jgi:hypothetical protein
MITFFTSQWWCHLPFSEQRNINTGGLQLGESNQWLAVTNASSSSCKFHTQKQSDSCWSSETIVFYSIIFKTAIRNLEKRKALYKGENGCFISYA